MAQRNIAATLRTLMLDATEDDCDKQISAVKKVSSILTSSTTVTDQNIEMVISSGFLPIFVNFLSSEHPALQYEAALAITIIASGKTEHVQALITTGALPFLMKLLESPHQDVCEQTVWALGNMVGDSTEIRELIFSLGIVNRLSNLLQQNTSLSLQQNLAWVVTNFCRTPLPNLKMIKNTLPLLKRLIHYDDVETLKNTLSSYIFLTSSDKIEIIQAVCDSEAVPAMIPLLSHEKVAVQSSALKALGNISGSTDEHTQLVLDCGALSHISGLLGHSCKTLRQEALWFVSNILGGSSVQIQAVLNARLLPEIVRNLTEKSTWKMAAWAVTNLPERGSKEQVTELVEEGAIPPICNLLDCENLDVVNHILVAIDFMLSRDEVDAKTYAGMVEKCGGQQKLKKLQHCGNPPIAELARSISDKYFHE